MRLVPLVHLDNPVDSCKSTDLLARLVPREEKDLLDRKDFLESTDQLTRETRDRLVTKETPDLKEILGHKDHLDLKDLKV